MDEGEKRDVTKGLVAQKSQALQKSIGSVTSPLRHEGCKQVHNIHVPDFIAPISSIFITVGIMPSRLS
jgi:hypothetical protein